MATKIEIAQIRWQEIQLARKHFNGCCFCCRRSVITNRKRPKPHTKLSFVGFSFHHLVYRKGEPRRKDYKGKDATWRYKRDVLPYVAKYPNEFLLTDKGCHNIIEKCRNKTKKRSDFMWYLIEAVKRTKT
jgi:hypothetical protein